MLSEKQKSQKDLGSDFNHRDRELVYRALVELRTDISDVKKMLANFIYSTFSNKDIKALPPALRDEINTDHVSDFNVEVPTRNSVGIQPLPQRDENEVTESEESVLMKFFGGDEIPSIEATEQFLIKQALTKYDGNRRKASDTLGISERTLYRKLDQYGLE